MIEDSVDPNELIVLQHLVWMGPFGIEGFHLNVKLYKINLIGFFLIQYGINII